MYKSQVQMQGIFTMLADGAALLVGMARGTHSETPVELQKIGASCRSDLSHRLME